MSKEQLEHFRQILLSWKRDLMEEVDRTVSHMKDEAANFPDPNDRATQEEEFSLELRTRDRERKLIRKIDEALEARRGRQLRLLPGDRRGDRHQAPRSTPGRHSHHRSPGAPRAARAAVRRPRRPLPLVPHRPRARATSAASPPLPPERCTWVRWLPRSAATSMRATTAAAGCCGSRISTAPRVRPGCADEIQRALAALGLHWDGEVEYQSRRTQSL